MKLYEIVSQQLSTQVGPDYTRNELASQQEVATQLEIDYNRLHNLIFSHLNYRPEIQQSLWKAAHFVIRKLTNETLFRENIRKRFLTQLSLNPRLIVPRTRGQFIITEKDIELIVDQLWEIYSRINALKRGQE